MSGNLPTAEQLRRGSRRTYLWLALLHTAGMAWVLFA